MIICMRKMLLHKKKKLYKVISQLQKAIPWKMTYLTITCESVCDWIVACTVHPFGKNSQYYTIISNIDISIVFVKWWKGNLNKTFIFIHPSYCFSHTCYLVCLVDDIKQCPTRSRSKVQTAKLRLNFTTLIIMVRKRALNMKMPSKQCTKSWLWSQGLGWS